MISDAVGGTAERIVARNVVNAARACFGTFATYSATVFVPDVFLRVTTARFREEPRLAGFVFFTRLMLMEPTSASLFGPLPE